MGDELMDELHDRALRAARAAETPTKRKRRDAEATAETSRNANLTRLINEASSICRRELGVSAKWRPFNNNKAVYAEIEFIRVEYHGHGRLSHTLASFGKELDRRGRHTCPNCRQRFIGDPKNHFKYVCRRPPFSARVGRLLRMIFPNTLGSTDPAVRGGRDEW